MCYSIRKFSEYLNIDESLTDIDITSNDLVERDEYDRILTNVKISVHGKQPKSYTCLWDTGSTESLISNTIINDFNPNVSGSILLNTMHGEEKVNKYEILLELPNHKQSIKLNSACFGEKRDFDVIIGMDIIKLGKFTYEDDKFSFVIK